MKSKKKQKPEDIVQPKGIPENYRSLATEIRVPLTATLEEFLDAVDNAQKDESTSANLKHRLEMCLATFYLDV